MSWEAFFKKGKGVVHKRIVVSDKKEVVSN
jgi:hypothetical protein